MVIAVYLYHRAQFKNTPPRLAIRTISQKKYPQNAICNGPARCSIHYTFLSTLSQRNERPKRPFPMAKTKPNLMSSFVVIRY